ncbi:mitochondrial import inner membrane translocase subunit Tim8-like [Portunus trituberculatus]|uniref:mitochondrial import inner membrane translocase subunit Tim8-like n=1 Tax=Portunus trituberculatus TaxID=210409 RepID=UPI001E1CE18F|nr:mitochondrial import inner membrane translocase subunit Tim8-like [Portunus trituberculatus]
MGWFFGDSSSDTPQTESHTSSFDENFSTDSGFSSFDTSSLSSGLDSSSIGGGHSSSKDSELQSFLMMEQQKAQMQAMIHKMNEVCWEVCVGSPASRLDARTETCISNCVDRFIDSSLFITNRFAQLLAKSGGSM